MENPTSILIGADNLTPEIAHADIAMPDLRHGKLHDMNAMKPPRHGDAQQFLDQELIMLEECIFAVIRYVLIVIAELIQARKRRTVDTKADTVARSEEHTSELQSLMRISYAVFCLQKKITHDIHAQ